MFHSGSKREALTADSDEISLSMYLKKSAMGEAKRDRKEK